MSDVVTHEQWESGEVKLSDEVFRPVLGDVIGYTAQHGLIIEHRRVIGYVGEETGTRVGTWFYEVMEANDE